MPAEGLWAPRAKEGHVPKENIVLEDWLSTHFDQELKLHQMGC